VSDFETSMPPHRSATLELVLGAIVVLDEPSIAEMHRTSHSACRSIASLGDVSNAPTMAVGQMRRRPSDHVLAPREVQQCRWTVDREMTSCGHGVYRDGGMCKLQRPWTVVNLKPVRATSTDMMV
jgi:hypothetical protein